jgi:hypothetical protein
MVKSRNRATICFGFNRAFRAGMDPHRPSAKNRKGEAGGLAVATFYPGYAPRGQIFQAGSN